MTHFFLQENFNGLISQGPWVFDSAQHKKQQPDMGLCPSTAVIVKWKDQFPSALKIEEPHCFLNGHSAASHLHTLTVG